MGRSIDVDSLVTAADIAERLDAKRPQAVHTWRRRHTDFPAPVIERGRVILWSWPAVRRWARSTGRL
jgi:hypothetical protein